MDHEDDDDNADYFLCLGWLDYCWSGWSMHSRVHLDDNYTSYGCPKICRGKASDRMLKIKKTAIKEEPPQQRRDTMRLLFV